MKLMLHELKRIRQYSLLTLSLFPGNKMEVTKKDVAEFTKDALLTIQRKRHKNMLLLLVESNDEG